MGPRAGLDREARGKILSLLSRIAILLVARHATNI
jgi:hypothetical protein